MVDGEPHLQTLDEDLDPDRRWQTVWLPTPDGEVAVSLVHRADVEPDGDVDLWLHVYGGFGISQWAGLGAADELFLAAGGVVGWVHARGGRERGEAWHTSAQRGGLPRTIDDVDAASAGLVARGWGAEGRVVLSGSSNGGLTVAAALARAPDRYGAAIIHAGVLDLLRGPRWEGYWWPKEYGRPRGSQREVLAAMSPRHHPPHRLPPTLVVTGAHDPVVPPRHSYTLAAAWDAVPGGPLLLRVDEVGSHGGRPRDRDDAQRGALRAPVADTAAFVLRALDLPVPPRGEEAP